MPRITPQPWQKLVKVFRQCGFEIDHIAGSHVNMTKPGTARPVIIPKYDEVGLDIIKSNMKTANLSNQQFLNILKKV